MNVKLSDLASEELVQIAVRDVDEVLNSSAILLFSENPEEAFKRGGRHTEFGAFLGAAHFANRFVQRLTGTTDCAPVKIIVVGPHEQVFHYHPLVTVVKTLEEAESLLFQSVSAGV